MKLFGDFVHIPLPAPGSSYACLCAKGSEGGSVPFRNILVKGAADLNTELVAGIGGMNGAETLLHPRDKELPEDDLVLWVYSAAHRRQRPLWSRCLNVTPLATACFGASIAVTVTRDIPAALHFRHREHTEAAYLSWNQGLPSVRIEFGNSEEV